MEANLYDQPAQARFLNTYVPINFGELYRIGSAQKEAVDQAQRELSANLHKWSEFQSPSAVDTARYYNLTIGKLSPVIEEMASNPDMIKTAEGRSKLQSMINNIDYKSLSNLKQSREGMLARQKANQELMLKGLFDPRWHDIDFANYDTLGSKQIFNDIAPLAYKSEVDLVEPFVNNLKDSFIKAGGGYEWYGVTPQQVVSQVDANMSSIMNTPYAQKHIEVLQQQGYTPEQATELFTNNIYKAAKEFARVNRREDTAYWENMKLAAKRAADKESGNIQNLTTLLRDDAKRLFLSNFSGLSGERLDQILKGAAPTPEEQQIISQSLDPSVVRGKIKNLFNNAVNETKNRNKALSIVADAMSQPLSDEANDILSSNGTDKRIGKNMYSSSNTSNFIRLDNLIYGLMGTTRGRDIAPAVRNMKGEAQKKAAESQVIRDKFDADLATPGRFHDTIVEGQPRTITDGSNVYHVKTMYIPVEQLEAAGYTSTQMREIGSTLNKGTVKNRLDNSIKQTYTFDDDVDEQEYKQDKSELQIISKQINESSRYLQVEVVNLVPSRGEAAINNDTKYNKNYGISTKLKDIQATISQSERR